MDRSNHRPGTTTFTALVAVLGLTSAASAQEILPPPPIDYVPVMPGMPIPGAPGEEPPGTTDQVLSAAEQALTWGVTRLHPGVYYRLIYGDGIQARPGEDRKTYINELAPNATLRIATNWAVTYSPVIRVYSNDDFDDGVNHYARFSGGFASGEWLFGLSQSYSRSRDPLIETGGQTERSNYDTDLTAMHEFTSKVSLQLGLYQNLRFSDDEDVVDSKSWSTLEWLNYQYVPQLGFALGVGGGYVDVSEGSDMTFEQVLGRITFTPGEKLALSFNGGVDIRQMVDVDADTLVNPIYGLDIRYRVVEATTLSINGQRTINAGYNADQLTENANIGATLRQRLLEKLFLDLSGGYRWTTYVATLPGLEIERDDQGFYFSARLSVSIFKRGKAGIFYYYSENSSDDSLYTYSSNQVGLELGYQF